MLIELLLAPILFAFAFFGCAIVLIPNLGRRFPRIWPGRFADPRLKRIALFERIFAGLALCLLACDFLYQGAHNHIWFEHMDTIAIALLTSTIISFCISSYLSRTLRKADPQLAMHKPRSRRRDAILALLILVSFIGGLYGLFYFITHQRFESIRSISMISAHEGWALGDETSLNMS